MSFDYKDAGVDIQKGDLFVNKITSMVKSTYDNRVVSGIGGFAALYKMNEEKYLASATDGVGTKLKLAQELNVHHTIGIDLVAMCVNDLLCTGASPLFFLDYIATGKLNLETSIDIVKGITEGCKQSEIALIGGETAEMPGMYKNDEYDLAGFSVGEVDANKIIDGKKIKGGDSLIAIASSGFHSNGYSLIRILLENETEEVKKQALTPTKIYVKEIKSLLKNNFNMIKGISHITGGGVHNISRLNPDLGYKINNLPSISEIPPIIAHLCEKSNLAKDKLYETFNMGMGLVLITDEPEMIQSELEKLNLLSWKIGSVKNDFKGIQF